MTGAYPAPTWGDIDAFCEADQWDGDRSTDHAFWEKRLPNGELLQTHRSFSASQEIGTNLFRMILREQLKVSREEFWKAVQSGNPVDRPVDLEDVTPTYESWVVQNLTRRGYSLEQIYEMTPDEAKARLQDIWTQPGPT